MASFQHTASFDSLTIGDLYVRGINNNSNIPAFNVLSADGAGGTMWVPLSTIAFGGGAFRTVKTTVGTYTSDLSAATFSLLDGPNAGLINDPTASNTVRIYAKAFGQFDISGGNTLYSFDPDANKVNSNVLLVGTGGINIKGDPQTNTLFFDGRELPFVSTLPYSFNQLIVYSNAPLDTLQPSTFSSIILQAQGPSSILSFEAQDLLRIETNYANNLVTFRLSTLTTSFVSTLITNQRILLSTYVQKTELSTFSTTYGQLISFQNLQANLCSMSTSILTLINLNSTNVGDVTVYSKGISTVWRSYLKDRYLLTFTTETQAQSTSLVFGSSIGNINSYLQSGYNILRGSTIQTPLFWTSTLVTQTAITNSTIGGTNTLNATLYPAYDSVYNIFGDTQPFGSPVAPQIYPARMDLTTPRPISTISTLTGIIFSTMYTVQGSFAFLPNDDNHPFQIEWTGNLALNINGSNYATASTIAYPRLQTFTSTTISANILGGPLCKVSFTYLKQNASDYISFSNMTDYILDADSFAVARMYSAYGYNTKDTPLLTQTITGFPIGFSTFSNTGPYLALSTYVLVASTFYSSGCNTMFPISSLGFNSISFYENATQNSAVALAQNLALSNTGAVSTSISASNAFGYNFTTSIPTSPYTLQLVFGKRQPLESLFISSLYRTDISYNYAYASYVSSLLFLSTLSSYNASIQNLNVYSGSFVSLQGSSISSYSGGFVQLQGTSVTASSLSSYSGSFVQLQGSSANVSSLSSYAGTFVQIQGSSANVSSLSSYAGSFVQIQGSRALISSISSINGSFLNINVSSINNSNIANIGGGGTTSASTFSTLATYLNTVNSTINVNLSSFSTVPLIPMLTTYLNQVNSTINVNISSFSTVPLIPMLTTYLNQVNSTINKNLSSFSTAVLPSGGGGTDASTISTLYFNIVLLTSSLSGNTSTFSTTWTPPGELYTSTLFASSITLGGIRQPFIQYGTGSISGSGTGVPLAFSYTNTYAIQLTYSNTTQPTSPLFASNVYPSSFYVLGDVGNQFYWTTFGTIN